VLIPKRAIPIPIMIIGMRLPHDRISIERVAASKPVPSSSSGQALSGVEGPEALGMVENAEIMLIIAIRT